MDMRGVCRAGATPQTEKYPVITEREKMLVMVRMAGFVQAKPKPITERRPPDRPNAFFKDFSKRFSGTAAAFLWSYLGFEVLEASSMGGLGIGMIRSIDPIS
jgi:hypothetical protein